LAACCLPRFLRYFLCRWFLPVFIAAWLGGTVMQVATRAALMPTPVNPFDP